MGEGGAVFTDKPRLKRVIESMRDWGRDCWCAPGIDNTCGKRFCRKLGDLPMGYDPKYTYSHCGRSEEHTSELQSLMRISYAVFCLTKKTTNTQQPHYDHK